MGGPDGILNGMGRGRVKRSLDSYMYMDGGWDILGVLIIGTLGCISLLHKESGNGSIKFC